LGIWQSPTLCPRPIPHEVRRPSGAAPDRRTHPPAPDSQANKTSATASGRDGLRRSWRATAAEPLYFGGGPDGIGPARMTEFRGVLELAATRGGLSRARGASDAGGGRLKEVVISAVEEVDVRLINNPTFCMVSRRSWDSAKAFARARFRASNKRTTSFGSSAPRRSCFSVSPASIRFGRWASYPRFQCRDAIGPYAAHDRRIVK
jgi:hypothetical protein